VLLCCQSGPFCPPGNFVLEPPALWIEIEIVIVIEIDFWQRSDFDRDFDFDFDFDECCSTYGGSLWSTLQPKFMKLLTFLDDKRALVFPRALLRGSIYTSRPRTELPPDTWQNNYCHT
jgi:hypothetical protein